MGKIEHSDWPWDTANGVEWYVDHAAPDPNAYRTDDCLRNRRIADKYAIQARLGMAGFNLRPDPEWEAFKLTKPTKLETAKWLAARLLEKEKSK